MFNVNQYANGFTLIETGPAQVSETRNGKTVETATILKEIAPIGLEGTGGPRGDGMFNQEEAEGLAARLNLAEKMIWTVTKTVQTSPRTAGANYSGLSHRASNRTETNAMVFDGPQAYERALACFEAEFYRLKLNGRYPGFTTTIEMSGAIHSLRHQEA